MRVTHLVFGICLWAGNVPEGCRAAVLLPQTFILFYQKTRDARKIGCWKNPILYGLASPWQATLQLEGSACTKQWDQEAPRAKSHLNHLNPGQAWKMGIVQLPFRSSVTGGLMWPSPPTEDSAMLSSSLNFKGGFVLERTEWPQRSLSGNKDLRGPLPGTLIFMLTGTGNVAENVFFFSNKWMMGTTIGVPTCTVINVLSLILFLCGEHDAVRR